MKETSRRLAFFIFWALVLPALSAGPQPDVNKTPVKYSGDQREPGVAVLSEVSLRNGALSFRVPTGGCTNKNSFRVAAKKSETAPANHPQYILTVERIAGDDCKGLFLEGVVIEIDLAKDLGLSGRYTVVIANPISPAGVGF